MERNGESLDHSHHLPTNPTFSKLASWTSRQASPAAARNSQTVLGSIDYSAGLWLRAHSVSQVGCVGVKVGATGVVGCAFKVTFVTTEIHPTAFFAVSVCEELAGSKL